MQKTIQIKPGSCCKIFIIIFLFLLVSCKKDQGDILHPWYPETNANNDPVSGVFESRIPCDGCERLKFALAIYKNLQTGLPTTYMMSRIYVGNNDDRVTNTGNISITLGTALNPLHTVYRLTTGAPTEYQSFWKIDENLLFILDTNLTPRVGDAGYGYVLNRVR
jgi:thioredoxin-related protein